MDKKVEEQIGELQNLEQNLQHMAMQKQVLQTQLMEIDNALEEIGKNPKKLFKIAGPLIVESSKDVLEKDLNSKKEMISIKLKNIDKQENKLRQRAKDAQAKVLSSMQKNG